MTTCGEILDKLTILYKRKEVLVEAKKYDNIPNLVKQEAYLLESLAKTIIKIKNKKHPGSFKKYKIYDENTKAEVADSLILLIEKLKLYNETLWQLEDKRRDKTKSDAERLAACDEVSIYNKMRNDTIDNIDEYIKNSLNLILEI